MPSYRVKTPGFYDGTYYDPAGKRPVLNVDTAFKKCPSWLEPIKGETPQQKAARTKAENKAKEEAEEKSKEDKKAVDSVTFVTSAEATTKTL